MNGGATAATAASAAGAPGLDPSYNCCFVVLCSRLFALRVSHKIISLVQIFSTLILNNFCIFFAFAVVHLITLNNSLNSTAAKSSEQIFVARLSISKQLQFISFRSNYFWQSSVKSNKQTRKKRVGRETESKPKQTKIKHSTDSCMQDVAAPEAAVSQPRLPLSYSAVPGKRESHCRRFNNYARG